MPLQGLSNQIINFIFGDRTMKRMLVLMLILGVASLASAEIFSPMEITNLGLGEFGISCPSGMSDAVDESGGYWVLIGVDATSGALAATLPASLDLSAMGGDAGDTMLFAAGSGAYGWLIASATGSWTAEPGLYVDSFTVQQGVTTLYLYTLDDAAESSTLVDTYIIPEPVTMALLGLGSLFLYRKK
jgi:hypothetical protein